jgi:hypothetical protein
VAPPDQRGVACQRRFEFSRRALFHVKRRAA